METVPKVSVIMGIYNCEKTLAAAIDSIIHQTYPNWELIMCDDGSIDGTYAIAETYRKEHPKKIVLLRNGANKKLAYTLNRCLQVASGTLVARMDGDDISTPDRLMRQTESLLTHPEYQLVGTAMRRFDETGYHNTLHPVQHPDKSILIDSTPFFHATILTYKRVYDVLGGYCTKAQAERVEDVDLWFRFYSKGFAGFNLDEPLYEVREDLNAIRRRTLSARIHSIQTRAVGYKLLGFPILRLICPALVLFLKGLIPPRIAMYFRSFRKKRKE